MTEAAAQKVTRVLAMFLFQHEKSSMLDGSAFLIASYSTCVHIYIYLQGVPRNMNKAYERKKLTMFKHRKENKLNNNWSQSLFTEVVARANARYQCEISRFHNSNMRASKLAKHCQCCMGHPVDWMYGTSISTQPQALGYWHRTSETLRSSGHTIPL